MAMQNMNTNTTRHTRAFKVTGYAGNTLRATKALVDTNAINAKSSGDRLMHSKNIDKDAKSARSNIYLAACGSIPASSLILRLLKKRKTALMILGDAKHAVMENADSVWATSEKCGVTINAT